MTRAAAARRGWEKRRELDERVAVNLPPDLLPLWERTRGQLRGSPEARERAFRQYVHDHAAEAQEALIAAAEVKTRAPLAAPPPPAAAAPFDSADLDDRSPPPAALYIVGSIGGTLTVRPDAPVVYREGRALVAYWRGLGTMTVRGGVVVDHDSRKGLRVIARAVPGELAAELGPVEHDLERARAAVAALERARAGILERAVASAPPVILFPHPRSSTMVRAMSTRPEDRDLVDRFASYSTPLGHQLVGDSRAVLAAMPESSVDLIVTSPPFALLREKSYGNKDQSEYVDWLCEFGAAALRVLKDSGSFVMDIGGAYQRVAPVRSLYPWRVLLKFCDVLGYRLAEEFYWHNTAKLPSPIEWVNKRKIRVKDSVNAVWWFSKSDWPKADVSKVLAPYSDRMKKLIADPDSFYRPKDRPSGHDISRGFATDNGGAIPPNLLQLPNTDSNSGYMRTCKALGQESHPARFPGELPAFFIKFLTAPGDVVVDIFSGSNTTGRVAEDLDRRWFAIEERADYAALSAIRFMAGAPLDDVQETVDALLAKRHRTIVPTRPAVAPAQVILDLGGSDDIDGSLTRRRRAR